MRLCRFGDSRLGLVEGRTVRDVTAALEVLPAYRYPLPGFDPLIANFDKVTARIGEIAPGCPVLALESLRLLSPVANPGKIIAAPVNYAAHLSEVASDSQLSAGNASHSMTIHQVGLFLKANSSLVGPGEGIGLWHLERRNDHEVELAV